MKLLLNLNLEHVYDRDYSDQPDVLTLTYAEMPRLRVLLIGQYFMAWLYYNNSRVLIAYQLLVV